MTSKEFRRAKHADLSLQQLADRLGIRELVDAYAHCADRRDADGQMALFTEDCDNSAGRCAPAAKVNNKREESIRKTITCHARAARTLPQVTGCPRRNNAHG